MMERLKRVKPRRQSRGIANKPSKLNVDRVVSIFSKEMTKVGFHDIRPAMEIAENKLRANGFLKDGRRLKLVMHDEIVYNRGEGSKSNFFVFTRVKDGKLIVFYTNPTDDTKGIYEQSELFIKKEIPISVNWDEAAMHKTVSRIVKEIKDIADKKDDGDYRFQIHFHMHHVLNEWDPIYDDGGSSGRSILRRLMLGHMDGFAPTPHNSVEPEMYRIFYILSQALHMTYVPGLELTATMYESNGPHHVVLFRSALDAMKFKNTVLAVRANSTMPPYFIPNRDGYNIFSMYEQLNEMKKEKRLATIVAHPIIQEEGIHLHVTGLMSGIMEGVKLRVFDTGEIRLLDFRGALDLVKQNEGIAVYNNALVIKKEIIITDKRLKSFLDNEMKIFKMRFGSPQVLSPTLATYLVGRRLARMFRLNTIYESDAHETKPLRDKHDSEYIAGADMCSAGYTRVFVSKQLRERLESANRILTSREFVEGLLSGDVRTKAYVFARVEDGLFQIASERRTPTTGYTFKTTWKVRFRRWKTYIRGVGGAIAEFIAEGKLNLMKYLTK